MFPVPKILAIDVTVVPDVVPDVALLMTYCLHIIRGSHCCPYGPQLCFLSQKILVIDVTVVPDVVPDVALLKTYSLHIIRGSLLWTPIVFPVPKILVIDVTVVPDVVPDAAQLKTYCLHITPSSLNCPYGPQMCFLSQKY